ncbi:unnamed protein product [Boreogadus saida]
MEDRKLIIAVCLRPVQHHDGVVQGQEQKGEGVGRRGRGYWLSCGRMSQEVEVAQGQGQEKRQEKKQGHRTIQTSPAVSQRTLLLLLLLLLSLSLSLSLSLPLALHVYLSLRLALPQEHRAGRRGREPGYQRGTTQPPPTKYPQPSSRPCRVVIFDNSNFTLNLEPV